MTIHTKQYRDNHCVDSNRNLSEENVCLYKALGT